MMDYMILFMCRPGREVSHYIVQMEVIESIFFLHKQTLELLWRNGWIGKQFIMLPHSQLINNFRW